MSDARTFYLVNDRVRANAVAAVERAPAGFTVTGYAPGYGNPYAGANPAEWGFASNPR